LTVWFSPGPWSTLPRMDAEIGRLGESPDGVFTTADARAVGLSPFDLVRMCRHGRLVHLARGIYAAPAAEPLSAERAHRRLAAGVCRLYPDAVLTHHSAAIVHGLPVFDLEERLGRVLLARPVSMERLAEHWIIRPRPAWLGSSTGPGLPTSDVASTLVMHALEHGTMAGVVALDRALHQGSVQLSEVETVAGHVAGWPRSHRVRTMVAYADGRSESVGESRLRVDLSVGGIELEPQVVIRDDNGRFVARVDLAVRGSKVVIEFDGAVKYADGGREALMAEKRREDTLRRLGYIVVRFTWADLYRPGLLVAAVRDAIAASLGKVDLHSA
jgi:very-short-patch-repair endonuclease